MVRSARATVMIGPQQASHFSNLYGYISGSSKWLVPLAIRLLFVAVAHVIFPLSQRGRQRAREVRRVFRRCDRCSRRAGSDGRTAGHTSCQGGHALLARVDLLELVYTLTLDRRQESRPARAAPTPRSRRRTRRRRRWGWSAA